MNIISCDLKDSWIQAAVEVVVKALLEDVEAFGEASLALSGGSTPYPVYQALASDTRLDWSKIVLVQVDERYVPVEDPEYNWIKITEALGGDVIMRSSNVCAFDTSLSREASVQQMEECLPNQLTVAILGMGTDGHIASLFPNQPWNVDGQKVLATDAPAEYPTRERLSLSDTYLRQAHKQIVLITGAEKQAVLQSVCDTGVWDTQYPVSLLLDGKSVEVVSWS